MEPQGLGRTLLNRFEALFLCAGAANRAMEASWARLSMLGAHLVPQMMGVQQMGVQLRQLMKTSKRRRCVCHAVKPHLHAKRCPMHMTFAGEILYPGCDVMTAEDSAWLRKRDKRYRLPHHDARQGDKM